MMEAWCLLKKDREVLTLPTFLSTFLPSIPVFFSLELKTLGIVSRGSEGLRYQSPLRLKRIQQE